MTACAEAFVPGSCVVLTHTTADVVPSEAGRELREAAALYSQLVAPFQGGEGEGPQSEVPRQDLVPSPAGDRGDRRDRERHGETQQRGVSEYAGGVLLQRGHGAVV